MRRRNRPGEFGGSSKAILIGIGTNLRRPGLGSLARVTGIALIRMAREGLRPLRLSRLYRSAPAPRGLGPFFTNAVVVVATKKSPGEILPLLHRVEGLFGRRRRVRNAPRPLDLDLLAVGLSVRTEGAPVLPHPGMAERPFVLCPLLDVVPGWRHPESRIPAATLLAGIRKARTARPYARERNRVPRKGLNSAVCRSTWKHRGSRPWGSLLAGRKMPWHV